LQDWLPFVNLFLSQFQSYTLPPELDLPFSIVDMLFSLAQLRLGAAAAPAAPRSFPLSPFSSSCSVERISCYALHLSSGESLPSLPFA
jgi:hypothetical protein